MTDQPDDYETGRTYTSAEISRRIKLADHNRRHAALLSNTSTAGARLRAAILTEFERFERDRRAEIIAAGGDPDEDRDPLDYVRNIAAGYDADAADSLDDYLDRLADELTLDDVRALRVAGEAAVAVTPRLIMEATGRGMKPDRIADEIGLTPSRVYQIIRDQRRTEAARREQ